MFKFPDHKPKQIELIFQKSNTDCGIACVAMLAYIFYDDALVAFKELKKSAKRGLFPEDVLEVLEWIGFSCKLVKSLPKKGSALVTINWKKKNLSGHFIVWDGKRNQFLDPIFGVIDKEDMLNSAEVEEIWKIKRN